MAVDVAIFNGHYTIDNYQWSGDDPDHVSFLNAILSHDHPTSDPDPDYTEALRIARLFSGKIVKRGQVDRVQGRVY